jgi:hypothetical protein
MGGPPPDGKLGVNPSPGGTGTSFSAIRSPRVAGSRSTPSFKGCASKGGGGSVSSAITGVSVSSSGRTPQASSKWWSVWWRVMGCFAGTTLGLGATYPASFRWAYRWARRFAAAIRWTLRVWASSWRYAANHRSQSVDALTPVAEALTINTRSSN